MWFSKHKNEYISYPSWRYYFKEFRCTQCSTYHSSGTYLPNDALVKNIMTTTFNLLRDDSEAGDIYQPVRVLCVYHHDDKPQDSLVRGHLNDTTASVKDRGRFPCGRPWCDTCAHASASSTINTPGVLSPLIPNTPLRAPTWVYIGETGRCLGGQFRDHLPSTRRTNTDLPVGRQFASLTRASTDMLASVIHSEFRDTQDRRCFDDGMIFKYKTEHPRGLN